MNFSDFSYRNFFSLSWLFFFAIVLSFIGDRIHLPIPWLLIPLMVAIIWALRKEENKILPKSFSIIGQAIIAIFTASRFSFETLITAQDYFLPLLICIGVTASFSLVNGYLIYKFADIDFPSSFLGCIPGAGPSLVAMSEDLGADAIAVTVLQYLRILMVSVIIPIIATFYLTESSSIPVKIIAENRHLLPSLPIPINLTIIALCAFIGVQMGKIVKLPSNLFLAPFFSCLLLFSFFPYEISLPVSIFRGGLLLLGLSIGVKFEIHAFQKLLKAVLLEIGLIILLIVVCIISGYWFHLVTKIDTLTALLGSTPGGISTMMATVIELGGNSGFVLTMQMTRMLLILTLTPFVANSVINKKEIS
ncbi:AbrB family transcriptional regulator [Geminocystis sp. GBBB08]|uniref:AbrB family transcriptional regulator n=1 Tax=Geminocystis sp. GBBB08 TaxID=2604140 RepID=UPI0027E364E0|nr:AbrB family transcriptional regulator [Geminocystis sp. GBBB08]MBL1209828.1 AbrB family transcriptional regulator [Geminocystis sp. GBBB08]